ncbi:hypothetical protein [Sorangium sp. So ce233]|uniref:hypothetical protein n=1 Tax=Sorangium sp. So ce233 TaxID=3133290 RepID=UPI003F63AAFD
MSRVYRPRWLLRLTVPVWRAGDWSYITFDVTPTRVRLELNDHNHADALDVDLDLVGSGVDPRWIAGATCALYVVSADDFDLWEPRDDNLRFVGRAVKVSRALRAETLSVEMTFHDYTSFFLLAKPVATDGIPLYADTLQDAWARLCAAIPIGGIDPVAGKGRSGVDALKDNLAFVGLSAPGPVIGTAVAQRFRKLGKVPVKPGVDAWAVWQQVVGMMGLISYFELDRCIVTTATDLFTFGNAPQIVYGKNLLDMNETRNNDRGLRGVGITSYDPLTGTSLEAIYDPLAGKRKPLKKRSKKAAAAAEPQSEEIDYFQVPGVTNPEMLQEIAKRAYEERSMQALEGSVTTADMTAETTQAEEFDLLDLRSGDSVEVRLAEANDVSILQNIGHIDQRVGFLVDERGYAPAVAEIVARNVDRLTSVSSLFYVKAVEVNAEVNDSGGSFRVRIDYMNKIDPTAGDEARQTPETQA